MSLPLSFFAFAAVTLVAAPAFAQTPTSQWPVCQVDRFTLGGPATGMANPTFNANSATPTMRLRRNGSCAVPIIGPRISMSVVTPPNNGTARIDGNRIQYEARPGFVGDDTFTVRGFAPDRSQNNTGFIAFRVQVRDASPPPATPTSASDTGPKRESAVPAQRATPQSNRPAEATPQSRRSAQPAVGPEATARLRQLQQLREQNLITEDEYQSRRQAIINSL
jgi:hypothetical protein